MIPTLHIVNGTLKSYLVLFALRGEFGNSYGKFIAPKASEIIPTLRAGW